MSALEDWIVAMMALEAKNLLTKPEGAMNIIVYDDTNVPPIDAVDIGDRVKLKLATPFKLTFWWRVGSLLDQMELFADAVIPASNWHDALQGILDAVEHKSPVATRPHSILSLQFWGHGTVGNSFMGVNKQSNQETKHDPNHTLNVQSISSTGPHAELISRIAGKMHNQGSVWFRQCNCFTGQFGQTFAEAAATAFGKTVVGHTFAIHVLQSGTRFLHPGQTPYWDVDEGEKRKHRPRKGQYPISLPLRRRTITMFRCYPPPETGEWILADDVLAAVKLGLAPTAADEV